MVEQVGTGVPVPEVVVDQIETKLRRKPTGGPELREYNKLHQQESRKRRETKRQIESLKYDSKLECKKSEALEILAQRVTNPHVLDVCYELGLKAAAKLGLTPNKFFFAHGAQQTLVSAKEKSEKFLELEHQREIRSEVIHQGDLYAIWDFSVSLREPDITFADFIEMRRILKSSWFELGRFLGIPFEVKPHKGWETFLPAFEPTLRPGYTLQDMRAWLAAQKSPSYPETTRDFLLQASRNTMKSTAALTLAASAVLCCPSIRLLLISETTKLSKDFIKAFRGFWESGSNPAYERFQYFFPEYCIEQGEGSVLAFTSPMRSFVLPQETAEPASMEVAAAGRRFDLGIFDDPISDKNTLNHEQREKGLNTYDALLKLREAGAGLTITVGTPWVIGGGMNGEMGDLYFELMKRNTADPEHPLAVKVEPAWILKPESRKKFPQYLNQITEEDLQELTCPSRWPFKALMKEARANLQMFMSQNLCMYVEDESAKWIPTFTLEELQQHVRHANFTDGKPVVMVVGSVDCANSESIARDRSSICIAKIIQFNKKNVAFIVDVINGHWKYSQLAVEVVKAFQRHGVQRAVLERNNVPWQELQAEIQRQAVIRGYPLPNIQWNVSKGTGVYTRSGISISAKLKRAKGAEIAFNNGQLYFAYGEWNEGLFAETVRFKGQRSGNSLGSKDDQIDALGQLIATFLPKDTGATETSVPTEEQLEMEQQMFAEQVRAGNYARMFGATEAPTPGPQYTAPEQPTGGIHGTLSRFGLTRAAA